MKAVDSCLGKAWLWPFQAISASALLQPSKCLFLYCLKLPVLIRPFSSCPAWVACFRHGPADPYARLGAPSDLHKPSLRLDCPGGVGNPQRRRGVWQGIPCRPLFSGTASKGWAAVFLVIQLDSRLKHISSIKRPSFYQLWEVEPPEFVPCGMRDAFPVRSILEFSHSRSQNRAATHPTLSYTIQPVRSIGNPAAVFSFHIWKCAERRHDQVN